MTRNEAIKEINELKENADKSFESINNKSVSDIVRNLTYVGGVLDALRIVKQIDEPKWHTEHDKKLDAGKYLMQFEDGTIEIYEVHEGMEHYANVSSFVVAWKKIEPFSDV